jgi:homoaconitase/3-isopropylmalate dehydratase large subunit
MLSWGNNYENRIPDTDRIDDQLMLNAKVTKVLMGSCTNLELTLGKHIEIVKDICQKV